MHAVWYEKQGPAREVLVHGEMPDPPVGPGQVLVKVTTSAVNPSDCNGRGGNLGRRLLFPRVIPHSDGAGTVIAVGEDVASSWIGQRVWIYNSQRSRAFGTAAELIAVEEEWIAPLPDNTSFEHGACLGIPAMTAWLSLFRDRPESVGTVLVTGGAGSVGHYAIQLAKWAGLRVIATVSSETKAAHAREAGADLVLNYRTDDVVARAQEFTDGRGVDRIVDVDLGGNLQASLDLLAEDGVIATYASMGDREPVVPVYRLMLKNARIAFVLVPANPKQLRDMAKREINRWLTESHVIHRIAQHLPLAQAAQAHELVERGDKVGAVVLSIDGP